MFSKPLRISIVHSMSQNYGNRGGGANSKETIVAVHQVYQIAVYIHHTIPFHSTVKTAMACPKHQTKVNSEQCNYRPNNFCRLPCRHKNILVVGFSCISSTES